MQRRTMYEIAKEAGVSVATVSRALHPNTCAQVSATTRATIERVARRRRYSPSAVARQLSRASYGTIGLVLHHAPGIFSTDYYTAIMDGIADALLDESAYGFKLIMLKWNQPYWDHYDFKSAESVDGILVTHWRSLFSDTSVFKRIGLPCVVISDPEPGMPVRCVSGDHVYGGRLAAEHLYQAGHRRIGIVTGPAHSTDSRLRVEGARAALATHGVDVPLQHMVCGEFSERRSAEVLEPFLRRYRDAVTALFCCNDRMAFGAVHAAARLGMRCPEDLSIVGYDNERRGQTFAPALTTIHVPIYDIARQAATDLVAHVRAGDVKRNRFNVVQLVEPTLIDRASVRHGTERRSSRAQ